MKLYIIHFAKQIIITYAYVRNWNLKNNANSNLEFHPLTLNILNKLENIAILEGEDITWKTMLGIERTQGHNKQHLTRKAMLDYLREGGFLQDELTC